MSKLHSNLITSDGIHNPKGFISASPWDLITKDTNGNLVWKQLCEILDMSNFNMFLDKTVNTYKNITDTNTIFPFTLHYNLSDTSFNFILNETSNELIYLGVDGYQLDMNLSMSLEKINRSYTKINIYVQKDTGLGFEIKENSMQSISLTDNGDVKNISLNYTTIINNGDKIRLAYSVTDEVELEVLNVNFIGRTFKDRS